MTDENLTKEEVARASAEAWADHLNDLWAGPTMSVSSAIYWICLRGLHREPADESLQLAAEDFMRAVKAGKITVYGHIKYAPSSLPILQAIPPQAFLNLKNFVPEHEDLAAIGRAAPIFTLDFCLTGAPDKLTRFGDEVLIDTLCVDADELKRHWPAGRGAILYEICRELHESNPILAQRAAWKIVRSNGTICTRDEFTEAWQSVAGKRPSGPKGPRNNRPENPDNSGRMDN